MKRKHGGIDVPLILCAMLALTILLMLFYSGLANANDHVDTLVCMHRATAHLTFQCP